VIGDHRLFYWEKPPRPIAKSLKFPLLCCANEGKLKTARCVSKEEKDARQFVYIAYVKKIILTLTVCIVSVLVLAHEFWFQPQKFHYSIREVARIRFLSGEAFQGNNWNGNKAQVQELLHYTPSGKIIDVAPKLSENKSDSLQLPLQEEGTHMVIFNSTNSPTSLGEKSNEQLNEKSKNGKQYYQYNLKTLLQVSYKITDDCTKPSSLPLDIIPEKNPYAVMTGKSESLLKVKFMVLFNQEPLNNALVKIWYYSSDKKEIKMDSLRTNKKGWIIANRHPGPYLLSCVHTERTGVGKDAEWQSYRASLSFEYSQFFPGSSTR
jgi:uncharacterized GH25 family protein